MEELDKLDQLQELVGEVVNAGTRGGDGFGDEEDDGFADTVSQSDIVSIDTRIHDDFEYNLETLPPHACAYCGIHSPKCVVQCLVCNKWFCNSRSASGSSHIVHHLVRARHKIVSLHPDTELGQTAIECYHCGSKNVFLLGFISAKADTAVVLLCRTPCALSSSAVDWDTSGWLPLINDRQCLPWLVSPPPQKELLRAMPVTPAQMARLEELWRNNPDARLSDLTQPDALEQEIEPLLLRYDDAYQYQRAFSPAVLAEAEYDRQLKNSQTEEAISVVWEKGVSSGRYLVRFTPTQFESYDNKLTIGDKIKLGHMDVRKGKSKGKGSAAAVTATAAAAASIKSTVFIRPGVPAITQETDNRAWITATVIKVPDSHSNEVVAEIRQSPENPEAALSRASTLSLGFTIEYLWSNITYSRMQDALTEFAVNESSMSGFLYHQLLGHEVEDLTLPVTPPQVYSVPGLNELNESQITAVKTVLPRPLSLIQGPPGTGKTVVSTTIVYHLVRSTQQCVLVCAPSNVAVDQLAERLEKTGLYVVRIMARAREHLTSTAVEHMTLHERIRSETSSTELKKLMQLKDELGELSDKDERRYSQLVKTETTRILNMADVVCATCSGAADRRLQGIKFRTVLVDESTQATEPECLIPIVHGCHQLVLVGDHQQLGPVIANAKAVRAGLRQSLFERLFALGHRPIRLTVQYRMHPSLSQFPSNIFYEGTLQNGVTVAQRERLALDFPWPVREVPMMFWTNLGQEEMSGSGTSYLNRTEAMNCEKVVTRLFKAGISPDQIGIVTPYEGQRAFVSQYMVASGSMNKQWYRDVEVQSVDAFQGREKDYIVVSCVRSNQHQGIGFLRDPRRLNVALTRAKYGLIVLGNPRALAKNSLWCYLLMHMRARGCLVEGPLNGLQPSAIHLGRPKLAMHKVGVSQRNVYANNQYVAGQKTLPGPKPDLETGSVLSYGGMLDDVPSMLNNGFEPWPESLGKDVDVTRFLEEGDELSEVLAEVRF